MGVEPLFIFVFTVLASTGGFVATCIVIGALLFLSCNARDASLFLFSAAGLMLSTTLVKLGTAVERPTDALVAVTTYGFPSGHAGGVMFLALSVCILAAPLPRTLRYLAYAASILFAVAVATSRVYLNVHTPLQIFAGFGFGMFWALAWLAIRSKTPFRNA